MTRKQEETKLVKAALKKLPYRTKVRHGLGTGSGWIKVYIPKKIWVGEHKIIEHLVANAVSREMNDYNHILVSWYE